MTADDDFKVGDAVYFNYRSATNLEDIHPGEKVPIHRTGAHLRHRST